MWGDSFCRNPLGPPISLWTTGTLVSRQFVLSVHSAKFVSVTSSVPLSVSLSLWADPSSDECLSGSDYNISSMSHSTRFLLVTKLVNACISTHNKHNAYWIGPHFNRLHYLESCMLLLWQPTWGTIELKIVMEQYNSRNSRRNSYNRMKRICFWPHICNIHWKELLYAFISSHTDCI